MTLYKVYIIINNKIIIATNNKNKLPHFCYKLWFMAKGVCTYTTIGREQNFCQYIMYDIFNFIMRMIFYIIRW